MINKKKLITLFILYFLSKWLFSQQQLTNVNSSWSNVLPGKVIYHPEISSYGFAVMTDAKNLMAFSNSGKLLWEKHLRNFQSPSFNFLTNDFVAVFTDSGTKLSLLNPDGIELWSKDFNYKIIDKAFSGRDGRFFIRGNEILSCFTITGTEKWSLKTPEQSSLSLQELTDGSLILFLKQLTDNKTKALRITPFGEIIEEIVFAGEVVTSITTPKGILLTFTDGTCGLFDLLNNHAEHKWLLKKDNNQKNNLDYFVLSQNQDKVIYINHHKSIIEIQFLDTQNGTIYQSFFIQNINESPNCFYNDSGIMICDKDNAFFYSTNGKLLWSGKMPQKNSREYYNNILFTTDNHFILFGTNWTINAFRTAQSTLYNENKKTNNKDYKSYYQNKFDFIVDLPITTFEDEWISKERFYSLEKGKYGKNETLWLSQLYSISQAYLNSLTISNIGQRTEKTVFETDSVNLGKLLYQLSLYQTDTFNNQIATILKKETNKSLLHSLLSGISKNGYDSDYIILETLYKMVHNLSPKDENTLCDICEAAYSICKIMGSDAVNSYGKALFTELLYPKYTSKTRDTAREKLKKLISNASK